MKKDKLLVVLIVVYFIATFLAYYFRIGGSKIVPIEGLIALLAPFFAVIGALYALNVYGLKSAHGKSFLYLTFGIFSYFLGELTAEIFGYTLGNYQLADLSNIFYLLTFPLFFMGFYREYKLGRIEWTKRKIIFVAILSLVLLIISLYPALFVSSAGDMVMASMMKVYSIISAALCVFAVIILMIVIEYKKGKIFLPWICLLLSILLNVLGDILQAIYFNQFAAFQWPYRYIDFIYIGSFLFFSYGMFKMGFAAEDINKNFFKNAL